MLAIVSTLEFDPLGFVKLNVRPGSAFQERRRRVNRIATLDGGSVVNDFGYAESDKTLALVWEPTDRATEAAIDRLARLYGRLNVSIDGAVYLAAVEAYTPGTDESQLRLLVLEKLTT